MAEDFAVRLEQRGGRTVVTVEGELDVATAPDLEKVLVEASLTDGPLFVDLTPTTFLDSTGLKVLVRCARQLDGRFTLVCPADNHPVMRVVNFAGFEQAFPVVESL